MSKRENGKGYGEAKCELCTIKYMTALNPPMSAFCPHCRGQFDIRNEKDAEEMLEMIDVGLIEPGAGVRPNRANGKEKKQLTQGKAAVKVDPTAVAAGIRATTDYLVAPVTTFEKPITYVTCKNGLFEVRHSDLATIFARPKEVLGVLEEGTEGVQLNIPKLPFEFLVQTISFFRGVCDRQKGSSEALVQIWWDRQDKKHHLHIPKQRVSGGGVHHESTFDHGAEGRWLHVADIHSHGSGMSAFWSGTDNHDETRVTTERLFGVIGKVTQPIPEWKWRMRTRDGFIDLTVSDLFEMPKETYTFTVKAEALFRSLKPETYKDGSVSLWCPVDPFTNVGVPAEWYAQVEGYSQGHGRGHGWGGVYPERQLQIPQFVKGFLYINNEEFEVDGTSMRATGHKLIKKGEVIRP